MPYEPGTLKAVNSKGKEEFVLKTAGEPAAIRLIADRRGLLHSKDSLHIALLNQGIRETFGKNLLAGSAIL